MHRRPLDPNHQVGARHAQIEGEDRIIAVRDPRIAGNRFGEARAELFD